MFERLIVDFDGPHPYQQRFDFLIRVPITAQRRSPVRLRLPRETHISAQPACSQAAPWLPQALIHQRWSPCSGPSSFEGTQTSVGLIVVDSLTRNRKRAQ